MLGATVGVIIVWSKKPVSASAAATRRNETATAIPRRRAIDTGPGFYFAVANAGLTRTVVCVHQSGAGRCWITR